MFDSHELISSYSRKEAIADGLLIEIGGSLLGEAGIKLPTALSIDLFNALDPTEEEEECGQTLSARLWDLLRNLLRLCPVVARNAR